MQQIRVFFALDLTDAIKRAIGNIIAQLQATPLPHLLNWIALENLHITLQFLAKLHLDDLPKLIEHINSKLSSISSFELELGELEIFPNLSHPRVISLNVKQQAELSELAKQVGLGMLAAGYPVERRPFRAHLSLARINRHFKLETPIVVPPLKLMVNDIVLFQSHAGTDSPKYTIIERMKLHPKLDV